MVAGKPIPIEERFWTKVDTSGGDDACWPWTAKSRTAFGYGVVSVNRRARGAHICAWNLSHGEIPKGQCVLHRCDNPICVNPQHLFLGTKKDNTRDMMAKGRMVAPPTFYGEMHPHAKYTDADVRAAREMHKAGFSIISIARKMGMSASGTRRMVRGLSWGHVT